MYNWHNVFQPIYQIDQNMNPRIDHYEMLLHDENDKFPVHDFFSAISTEEDNQKWIQTEAKSLEKLFSVYPNINVGLNIEPIQFAYPSVWDFLHDIYNKYGQKVALEITERQLQAGPLGANNFDCSFQRIHDMGFRIALDDVDSGSNSFEFINHHADKIDAIKLSLLIFDNIPLETTVDFIHAWSSFAKEKNLDLILEAVRSKYIAEKFAGDKHIFQQGYYWSKPLPLDEIE